MEPAVGAWQSSTLLAFLTATGLILGATYMLWLYRRVVFGRAEKEEVIAMTPLEGREMLIFAPLTVLVLWYGIFPGGLLDTMQPAIATILGHVADAADAMGTQ